MTWTELSGRCVPSAASTRPQAALVFGGGETDADRVEAVLGIFSEHRLDSLLVVDTGAEVGVLRRNAVLDFVGSGDRAIGSSGPASIPGRAILRHFEAGTARGAVLLHCPRPSCPRADVFVMGYDPNDPPTCAVHVDQVLVAPDSQERSWSRD
ncbi:hypothetical protein ACQPW3_26065 [Actinosynnema sp. CA-248983]